MVICSDMIRTLGTMPGCEVTFRRFIASYARSMVLIKNRLSVQLAVAGN